uniref:Uncharacterized protein n=1 Tax=Prymnesium polylepis TaxID=72548 RepID=A0A7S4HEN1_9EUKA
MSRALRSATARSKRKAGVPAAPQAKRGDRKPWGLETGHFQLRFVQDRRATHEWGDVQHFLQAWQKGGGGGGTVGDKEKQAYRSARVALREARSVYCPPRWDAHPVWREFRVEE